MQGVETLKPGSTIDGYTVGVLLGTGGFGAVYGARAPDGRDVALKISHENALRSTSQAVRVQNEIEVLARLRHPALVEVRGYGFTSDGRFYLAMERVEGVRLDHYLRPRGRLEPIEAIPIVRKVADAMAYCHELDVLHLDLKPENVTVTDPHDPRVKVLDFGLAHLVAAPGLAGAPRGGTLPHMAPEYFQAAELSKLGPSLDLYAIGTILYELLSGTLPFQGHSPVDHVRLKLTTDPRPLREIAPSVPEPLCAVVHQLLARDPAARISSAALLSARLKEVYYAILSGTPSRDVSHVAEPPPSRGVAPFVGRGRELQALLDDHSACAQGPGRAALLVADAGLGKSRLLAEAVRRCARADEIVIYGRCRQLGELVPYSPLREAMGQLAHAMLHTARGDRLRGALHDVLASDAAVLGSVVPEFYETPPHGEAEDLSAFRRGGSDRVAQAVANVLAALPLPAILALEDLHWADAGTRAVLSKLLSVGLPRGVLLLGTSRTTDDLFDSPNPSLRVIRLLPLTASENDHLLSALVGGRAKTEALKQSIPLLSAGNPLFVTQVIRDLEAEGYLHEDGDVESNAPPRSLAGYEPPDSVSMVLERVLRRLPPHATQVLSSAALIGRVFTVPELAALELYPAADIAEAVAESERLWLCRVDGDTCTFVHDTIREHLANAAAPERLRDTHRRIARVLERRGAPPGTLGDHLEQAGETQQAAEAYFQAGLEADRLHDAVGGRRHFERAFRLLTSMPPTAERSTMLARTTYELVRVGCALGDTSETLRYLDECERRIPAMSPEQLAALDSSRARLAYVQGELPLAMDHAVRCLATVREATALRAYQCFPANVVGRARCISGRFGEAVEILTHGCALARETREYIELSHSEGLLGVSHAFTGDFASAWRHALISIDLARRLGDPLRIIGALVYRAAVCEATFEWEQGVRDTTELLAFAEEQSMGGLYLYVGTVFTGRHQFHVGNLGRARVLLGNAINLSTVLKMASIRSWAHAWLGDVHFVSGQLEHAGAQYKAGIELARSTQGDELAEPLCLAGLAHLGALANAPITEVCAQANEAIGRLKTASNQSTLVSVLQRCAEAMTAAREPDLAREYAAQRADLVRRLRLKDCDFWPIVPTAAASTVPPPPPREYWTQRTLDSAGTDGGLFDAAPRESADTQTMSDSASHPATLLDSLASVEGFLPRF
jgi:tetratricopeptide (TPR) repeat protein